MPKQTKPIQEALILVRLEFEDSFSANKLDEFYEHLKDDLPQKQYTKSMKINFDANKVSSIEDTKVDGVILRAADGTKALQVNKEAFLFSYINQYTTWEDLIGEGTKYLKLVLELLNPKSHGAISTRFINNISVPIDRYGSGAYFETKILFKNKDEHPQEYLIQYVDSRGDIECNVVQTCNAESTQDNKINVILDINAIYNKPTEISEVIDPNYEPWNRLRTVKNEIFDEILTEEGKRSLDD